LNNGAQNTGYVYKDSANLWTKEESQVDFRGTPVEAWSCSVASIHSQILEGMELSSQRSGDKFIFI